MSLLVWIDQSPVGLIVMEKRPGFQQPSMTFTYSDAWLADTKSFAISPDLPLVRGPQTPAPHRSTFLAFDDAAPDRWGRKLIEAKFRRDAIQEKRRPAPLSEADLVLAVSDDTRQGAIRFQLDGEFVAASEKNAGIQDLPDLVAAAQRFEETGVIDAGVSELIGVGSSPGGAHPKAWVRAEDGHLLLAKFPRVADVTDASAWELAAIELQKAAGIDVAPSQRIGLGPGRSVFITERFDRRLDQTRIPYMSFRTAFRLAELEHPDYASLARRLGKISSSPSEDLPELFSRAAFNAMANNIDDHMRNFGLLHTGNGWRLSPSFDVNPEPRGRSDTPLTQEDFADDRDVRNLLDAASQFRLTQDAAVARLRRIDKALDGWRDAGLKAGVEADALDFMANAFEGPARQKMDGLRATNKNRPDRASTTPDSQPGQTWVRPHLRDGQRIEGHFRKRK
ncbi:type II toxin-antitoxin system HipA family toxin [Pseudarthrobacter sp. J1763]|uniref:type II toxin-antitoxin system HipA family toxin n=1 Tax=Pseudarthrobacter sp. J1763 TaxID=3420445 RepID=UPI003D2CECD3